MTASGAKRTLVNVRFWPKADTPLKHLSIPRRVNHFPCLAWNSS